MRTRRTKPKPMRTLFPLICFLTPMLSDSKKGTPNSVWVDCFSWLAYASKSDTEISTPDDMTPSNLSQRMFYLNVSRRSASLEWWNATFLTIKNFKSIIDLKEGYITQKLMEKGFLLTIRIGGWFWKANWGLGRMWVEVWFYKYINR